MNAGAARIDITPDHDVWMDGMIRDHQSTGVHDPIFAKALVLANGSELSDACALVSLDLCVLATADCRTIRDLTSKRTGIPADRIILAATHNHSGPATMGLNNPRADAYMASLPAMIVSMIEQAVAALAPAAVGCASGREDTISHYRRLLADDGHVVMNWEPWPAEKIIRLLGTSDPEVGVLKIVAAGNTAKNIALLFNHAGHPNVLSGDNYRLTPDYPGLAEKILEKKFGGTALFINGAQGSVDIDGLKDRDWAGRDRVGQALADAVARTAQNIQPSAHVKLRAASTHYTVPARKISAKELAWADEILKQTGGAVKAVADGVGDDYKANLYRRLSKVQHQAIPLEQIGIAIDNCVFISFPGELFTEIGMQIKAASPFGHTYIIGLANGYMGYVPTRAAISQGGYEPDTRATDDAAAEQIAAHSLELLRRLA
ncbi:MAG: neutral/alkaline non-lysosomal ceramidase N-terminal domain-containing protein [Verrucomicrobiota bacterium]